MKKHLFFFFMFTVFNTFSQNFKRTIFNYEKLKIDSISNCDEKVLATLELSIIALEENNSRKAVELANKEYSKNKECPQVYEVYGYSLFRRGDWFDGLKIIENGIEKFGPNQDLINRKIEMSLEMAEMGIGAKNIDGSTVYKANKESYDEDQFIKENYKSALNDLEYLVKVNPNNENLFYSAKIHQILGNYEKSNDFFKKLLNDEEYRFTSIFNIAENYIQTKQLEKAEKELIQLVNEIPKEGKVYKKLSEVYELKKEKNLALEFKNKGVFYSNLPNSSDLIYSKENLDLLFLFGSDEKEYKLKSEKLNEIHKQNNQAFTIDICLLILKLHANHGNGLEDDATEILKKIGKPSIDKVNLLFESNISTCTITNLADIMASVKDEKSWELLKKYLPEIAHMPMTTIPPSVPEKMIKFNEDEGIKEILIVVKSLLKEDSKSDDPLAELMGFGQYVYYSPLEKINKSKLEKIATELGYTKEEFKLLEAKIK